MGTIFSRYKDAFLDLATDRETSDLSFPLLKTGDRFNGYTKGDFIVIGGRKTSGKSSFILNNYVISPIYQKVKFRKSEKPFDVKILYINTRKPLKTVIERMIVNYTSYKSKGVKLGVPSLYGYRGNEYPLTKSQARGVISTSMNIFDTFVEKGHLRIITGRKSLFEIDQHISDFFEEFGSFDDDGVFDFDSEFQNITPIVVIDDASGVYGEAGHSAVRNDTAVLLASKLKELSKTYDSMVILGVPSHHTYIRRNDSHVSSLDEIFPYPTYCDRSIILHNPAETNEGSYLGYEVPKFINNKTGICYLRTGHVTSNYMGASGVMFGFFMYPENGYMLELPAAEEDIELTAFYDKVLAIPMTKEEKALRDKKRKEEQQESKSVKDDMADKDLEETEN